MSRGKIFNFGILGRFAVVGDRHGSATRAKTVTGDSTFETRLFAKVIRGAEYMIDGKKVQSVDLVNYSADEQARKEYIEGTGYEVAVRDYFGSNWFQKLVYRFFLYRDGRTQLDLGSGLVTNVGVMALANEFAWANPSGAVNTVLGLSNFHATGTGATAAAATDIALQAVSTQGGQTPVAGAQTLISAANVQKYQTVATISYTGTEAVTEWGLHTANTLSATTGTPFTATTAASATATGTPYTASSTTVPGQQIHIVKAGTTAVYGLVLSNSTSVLTIPAWYKTTDGTAGATPGATEAFTILPVMSDHKVFSAINVINGDSIQFTYQLTVNSGG